jgi:hypothetical protein
MAVCCAVQAMYQRQCSADTSRESRTGAVWSGRWESNPRLELGKLRSCH